MLEIAIWSRSADMTPHGSVADLKSAQLICAQSETMAKGLIDHAWNHVAEDCSGRAGSERVWLRGRLREKMLLQTWPVSRRAAGDDPTLIEKVGLSQVQ